MCCRPVNTSTTSWTPPPMSPPTPVLSRQPWAPPRKREPSTAAPRSWASRSGSTATSGRSTTRFLARSVKVDLKKRLSGKVSTSGRRRNGASRRDFYALIPGLHPGVVKVDPGRAFRCDLLHREALYECFGRGRLDKSYRQSGYPWP